MDGCDVAAALDARRCELNMSFAALSRCAGIRPYKLRYIILGFSVRPPLMALEQIAAALAMRLEHGPHPWSPMKLVEIDAAATKRLLGELRIFNYPPREAA